MLTVLDITDMLNLLMDIKGRTKSHLLGIMPVHPRANDNSDFGKQLYLLPEQVPSIRVYSSWKTFNEAQMEKGKRKSNKN